MTRINHLQYHDSTPLETKRQSAGSSPTAQGTFQDFSASCEPFGGIALRRFPPTHRCRASIRTLFNSLFILSLSQLFVNQNHVFYYYFAHLFERLFAHMFTHLNTFSLTLFPWNPAGFSAGKTAWYSARIFEENTPHCRYTSQRGMPALPPHKA